MNYHYLSVCSGIEAATVAWHSLGWTPLAFSEIEKFPSQVLAHHYPNTPNLGDMTRFKEWNFESDVNVLVGGTPCQSFSVAGLRKGLDDPRGNLMLTYLAIAAKQRPKWVVWENVPGVLSSNGGLDFASFLRGLGQLGYGFAYRILDAQYFGVAQRRRRVFVVGHIGDWQRAAAVLFERHSLQGHPAPRRKTGKRVAGTIEASLGRSRGAGTPPGAIQVQPVKWPTSVAPALDTTMKKYMGLDNQHINGGGGGLYQAIANPLTARMHKGINTTCDEGQTLIPTNGGGFDVANDSASGLNPSAAQGGTAVIAPSLTAFNMDSRSPQSEEQQRIVGAVYKSSMQVRRLTPRECERLQGFPDDYTLVQHRNKPSADGPRYKALGNSMAVPVMRWIGRRIAMVEQLKGDSRDD